MRKFLFLFVLLFPVLVFAQTSAGNFPYQNYPLNVIADHDFLGTDGQPVNIDGFNCLFYDASFNDTIIQIAQRTATGAQCTVPLLPVGGYSVYVVAYNDSGFALSEPVYFTLSDGPVPPDVNFPPPVPDPGPPIPDPNPAPNPNPDPNPPPPPDPPNVCTVCSTSLLDAEGNLWTLGMNPVGNGFPLLRNGVNEQNGQGIGYVLVDGFIYSKNNQGNWYRWEKNFGVSSFWNGPMTAPVISTPPVPQPPPPTATIHIQGTILVNGVEHPFSVDVP